jgi:hypothetical protein
MKAGKCTSGDHHEVLVTNVMVFGKSNKLYPETFGWGASYIIQIANGRARGGIADSTGN